MTPIRWSGIVLLLSLAMGMPAGAADCPLVRVATLDMRIDQTGRPLVPVVVAGRTVELVVGTGRGFSTLSRETVEAVGAPVITDKGWLTHALGGKTPSVVVHELTIGGLKAHDVTFGLVPADGSVIQTGALGAFFLKEYDADFDFAGGKLNLISPDHCPGRGVYWSGDATAVGMSLDWLDRIWVAAKIDGKEMPAMIDTESSVSVMPVELAKRLFGIDASTLQKGSMFGDIQSYRYPFKTLSFGGVGVTNPNILLLPGNRMPANSDWLEPKGAVIGMDVLRQLHVYAAYRERKLYLSAASAH